MSKNEKFPYGRRPRWAECQDFRSDYPFNPVASKVNLLPRMVKNFTEIINSTSSASRVIEQRVK